MSPEANAIKNFQIFTVAVVAAVAVRFAVERWFEFPEALAMALAFFVMGMIIKPLVAPDLRMSRWVIVPLAGMAIVLVILTAPRWYEQWRERSRTLPGFLPTEEDFVAQVLYYAEGPDGDESPRNCGSFARGEDTTVGKECVLDALNAGEPFYLIYTPPTIDTFGRAALASYSGTGARRFYYSSDVLRARPRSSITSSPCPDARFLEGPGTLLQCGPWPTPSEFREEVRAGTDCGSHSASYDVTFAKGREQIECVTAALENREAFHFRFDTDWGDEDGIVDGALSWQPETEPTPMLFFYLGSGAPDEAERTLIRRACEAPRIRLVKPTSPNLRRDGRDSSVEVDCGDASFPPR